MLGNPKKRVENKKGTYCVRVDQDGNKCFYPADDGIVCRFHLVQAKGTEMSAKIIIDSKDVSNRSDYHDPRFVSPSLRNKKEEEK